MPKVTHIVFLKWKEGTSTADVQEGCDALARIPSKLHFVKSYRLGGDLKISPGNHDFAIIGEFASAADYKRYATSDEHLAAVALLKPHIANRSAVQTEITEFSALAAARTVLVDNVVALHAATFAAGVCAALLLRRR